MREILFRGKSKFDKDNKWVYGDLIQGENAYISTKEKFYSAVVSLGGHLSTFVELVDKKTIGQYTGLCDKNGTKIFEGDIVLADFEYKDERMEVIFYQCGFKLKSKNCEYYYDYSIHDESAELEVIGNIYDNPELLEE